MGNSTTPWALFGLSCVVILILLIIIIVGYKNSTTHNHKSDLSDTAHFENQAKTVSLSDKITKDDIIQYEDVRENDDVLPRTPDSKEYEELNEKVNMCI